MDYISVALAANITAFVATCGLLLILTYQARFHIWKRYLLIGAVGQFIWSLTLLTSYYSQISATLILHSELLRQAAWLASLYFLLHCHSRFRDWPRNAQALLVISALLIPAGLYTINTNDSSVSSVRLVFIAFAILNLVFTEQVVRNLNAHRMMKLLALCLSLLFAYDILVFGQGLVTNTVTAIVVQGRVALAFTVALALTVGTIVFSEKNDTQYLFSVSRPAAFYSTTVLLSALLILIVVIGSIYIQDKGFLGTYLFSLALLIALLLVLALIISRTFRQHFEVFISKHFFALKYDYRIEWLNAIRQLSELNSNNDQYYNNILAILRSSARSQLGSLWISNGSELKPVAGSLNSERSPDSIAVSDPFVRTMLKESWIFVPQSRETSLAKNNHLLPEWITDNESIWLIAPLIIQMKLVGFTMLSRPRVSSEVTYEDRDLMTNVSTQIASHLLLHQQEKVISDAKQMETYNRLSAFIMHDMNNVIAQLALIGKNAERHKNNPAFVDDMIKTVFNATARMQSLVQKFNPASKDQKTAVPVCKLLSELIDQLSDQKPIPVLTRSDNFNIQADPQRLSLALKNLIRNAQEATPDDGFINIECIEEKSKKLIVVKDNGQGMTSQFIREDLFRPFSTTKDENGLGIGAYLTKSYLEHLGALLNVSSAVGKGTEFRIDFS